jgi:hypothetical protein
MNPINFLTVDLEDYFQVHAFSNVIRFEEWDKYESRIERNTFRILEILNECVGPNNSMNSSNPTSVLSPQDSNFLPHTSNLKPQGLDLTPCSMASALCRPVRATFFILGWIAERYPDLIRRIQKEGHEIACHGYAHKLIYHQSKEEFRGDIRKAKAILENIIGDEVIGYRAPSYSITNKSQWAFEILTEEGFKYDSSIFPIHHDFYGFPNAPRFPFVISLNGNSNFEFRMLNFELKEINNSALSPSHSVLNSQSSVLVTHHLQQQQNILASNEVLLKRSAPLTSNDISVPPSALCSMRHASSMVEFPISTLRICGQNLPISGGGYFRLFPYSIIKKGLTRINRIEGMPFIFYLHPWELDDEQPRINNAGKLSRFRHYVNLGKTEGKFKKLLRDFNFLPIGEIIQLNNPMNH